MANFAGRFWRARKLAEQLRIVAPSGLHYRRTFWNRTLLQLLPLILLSSLLSSLSTGLVTPNAAGAAWYAGGTGTYGYKKLLTIDYTKVGGSTLSNFPVLVSFTDNDLKTTGNGGKVTNANGYDIIFVANDDATKLDHEIESYNATTGALVMWVRIPSLSGSANTTFYVYFGNNTISTSQQNVSGVWDANFKTVQHLKESGNGTAGEYVDSTSTNNDGRGGAGTAANVPTQRVGKIGNAQDFDGNTDFISNAVSGPISGTGSYTLEAWINPDDCGDTGGSGTIWKQAGSNSIEFDICYNNSGDIGLWLASSNQATTAGGVVGVTGSAWQHVVLTQSSGTVAVYVNGAAVSMSDSTVTPVASVGVNYLGQDCSSGGCSTLNFDGGIDELRLSNAVRSTGWITCEYNNANSPSTFMSVGATQTPATLEQTGYRWYSNNNLLQPATPLANEDTMPVSTNATTGVRLRMQVGVTGSAVTAASKAFSLQFATSTSGPWTTVTGASSTWRYLNATPADDTTISAGLLTGTTALQTYSEADPTAANPNSIAAGGFGEWDFSLTALSGITSDIYYFRMIESGGTALATYTQYAAINVTSHLSQVAYRFYGNNNSTDVGTALAAQDTAATAPTQGTPFRLRISQQVSTYVLPVGYESFKLQYAARSGTCDTAFSGETYADVSPSAGAIRYYNNATPADGATATANGNDPNTGSPKVMQTYEESNDLTSVNSIAVNSEGVWDFALVDNSATGNTPYCFRLIRADGSLLTVYSSIPQITTAVGNQTPNVPTNLVQTKTNTTGIPGTTRYNFDASTQSWSGDTSGGTTYALDTTDKRTGAGSTRSTIAASDTNMSSSITFAATDMSSAGPVFSAWVYTPVGTSGTPTAAISVTGNSQTINGSAATLDKGFWTLVTVTAPPDVLAAMTGITIAGNSFASAGTKQVNFDDVQQGNGIWTNETSVRFSASASDPDGANTVQLCIEAQPVGTGFTGTETSCNTLAAQGTSVHTLSGLTNGTQYHWQARVKDNSGTASAWVAFGGNKDTVTASPDFGIDSSNPTAGSVKDGAVQGSDVGYNTGALDTLSGNWTGFSDGSSGLARYEYSFGTSAGGTTVTAGWLPISAGTTEVTETGLTLQTGQMYYLNVRAVDIAGNTVAYVSSNGQMVAPTLTFTADTALINFAKPTPGNSYSPPTKTVNIGVQSNAYGGYVVRQYASALLTDGSKTVSMYTGGSYGTPTVWSGTGFGYTTTDTAIQAAGNPFNGATRYAPLTLTAPGEIVADRTTNITGTGVNDSYALTYKLVAASNQKSGSYSTNVRLGVIASY